jgi:hypothetical protein
VRVSRGGPLGRQVCSDTRARSGREKDATGAAGRMSRRRHHERHGHYGVNVRWHEYRGTAGDVKTSVVRRGVDIDQQRGVIPHQSTGYHLGDGGGLRDTVGVIPHWRQGNGVCAILDEGNR